MTGSLRKGHPFVLGVRKLGLCPGYASAGILVCLWEEVGEREAGAWQLEGLAPWMGGWAAGAEGPYNVRGTTLRSRLQTGLGRMGVPQMTRHLQAGCLDSAWASLRAPCKGEVGLGMWTPLKARAAMGGPAGT